MVRYMAGMTFSPEAKAVLDEGRNLFRGFHATSFPNKIRQDCKLGRADATIDWTLPAAEIDARIRAFDPVPGSLTHWRDEAVKVWSAQPSSARAGTPPGTIFGASAEGIDVACGEGVLRLTLVQPAGGKRMDAAAFATGRALRPGMRFGAPVATG